MHALKILIIDDDTESREILEAALNSFEESVLITVAVDGREGLSMLKDGGFDCVFLSDALPDGSSGVQFLREACTEAQGLAPAPVVMLMGHGREQAVIEAIRAGAQDYLARINISPETVRVAINQAAEIYDLKRRHRQAQEQLFQVQKLDAVGQLTGGIAHDFNNLLTIILGNARLLRRSAEEAGWDPDKASRIQIIENTARRGAEMVRRLMVFSRQQPFDLKVVSLNDTIRQLTTLLGHTLGETVFVKTVLSEELERVNIDVGQFENAVLNMVVNARDAMPRGGTLTIETQNVFLEEDYRAKYPDIVPGPYVMVAISDNGEGMPPEVAAHIFEPFFTTKGVGQGTGLGLSMAYGFVRESGGFLHVYSEQGQGTVFRMYLPQLEATGGVTPFPRDAGIENGNGEVVMIVDDDERLRQMASTMLIRLGYETLMAANGEEALGMLEDGNLRVDAVLTDVSMQEGMSGIDLAGRLQKIRPGIGILFMTGFSENALSLSGPVFGLAGDYSVIGKPFRREVLARKLRSILPGGGKKKEGHSRVRL